MLASLLVYTEVMDYIPNEHQGKNTKQTNLERECLTGFTDLAIGFSSVKAPYKWWTVLQNKYFCHGLVVFSIVYWFTGVGLRRQQIQWRLYLLQCIPVSESKLIKLFGSECDLLAELQFYFPTQTV